MPSIISRLNCFYKKSKKRRFTDERSIDDEQKLALVGSNVTSTTNKMGRSESSSGSKSHLHLSRNSPANRQTYDDDSLPTIDSHYNQVKSGDRSLVSDAEGTFGTNNPSLTGFSQADRSAYGTVATPAQAGFVGGNNSIEGQLLKDYYGSNQPAHLMASPIQQQKEQMLEIYAPAGRLGLVIDCPTSEDTPIVHAIKDTCPIRNEIYVGDKLVAVDDEDVREFNAVQVSRLISKKSEQKRRKLTIIRTSRGRDGMY